MPLIKSILRTLLLYFLLQSLAFLFFFHLWAFSANFLPLFFLVQLGFYAIIAFFLIKNKNLFYSIRRRQMETTVNGANKVTLFRITMLPFLTLLTLVSQNHPAGPVLAAACALTFTTDFIDGRIAKTRGLETYIGRILDSASDYLLLGITAGAFFFFKLLKSWLFWIIIGRLLINAIIMILLFVIHKKLRPQTTPMGKITIAVIMVLLVIEAAKPLGLPGWIGAVEKTGALVIGLSMIDKFVYFIRNLHSKAEEGDQNKVPCR
jgi:phosphatidylglycerophosphate synthase